MLENIVVTIHINIHWKFYYRTVSYGKIIFNLNDEITLFEREHSIFIVSAHTMKTFKIENFNTQIARI